ncbi:acyl carrier protein [Lacticaseibacillus paracasei subsp. paracasei CNCM I-4648]|nr:acyl carrier protein [Lacticaseibacillus paracasei subsp. paracasei CNCM I-4648]
MSEDEIYQKIAGLIQDHFQLSPDKSARHLTFKRILMRIQLTSLNLF